MKELDELREELVEARAEAQRLAETLADREARSVEMAVGMESLRREMEAARSDAAGTRAIAAEEAARLTAHYREALVQVAPDVPADLIRGESVEDLDRSLAAARDVVARVREQMRSEAATGIPTGSPVRTGPDVDALSPAEKIRAGIAGRRE